MNDVQLFSLSSRFVYSGGFNIGQLFFSFSITTADDWDDDEEKEDFVDGSPKDETFAICGGKSKVWGQVILSFLEKEFKTFHRGPFYSGLKNKN